MYNSMNLLEEVSGRTLGFMLKVCALLIRWKRVEKFKPKVEEKKVVGNTIV
jgi:hypothetical protein